MIYGFNRKGREILMARFCFGNHSIEFGVRTRIMGILNVTPDSFSDGGKYDRPSDAVGRALEMEREGADIIDIGAQSTRPGHVPITAEQEWERLEPVLAALKGRLGAPISVDTFYPEVAAAAVAAGASIINDVSGGIDNGMIEVAIKTGAGIVMMHGGGGRTTPETPTLLIPSGHILSGRSAMRKRRGCRLKGYVSTPALDSARTDRGILLLSQGFPRWFRGYPGPPCWSARPASG